MSGTPLVVLCPGQGAQAVGMGRAWFDASPEARTVFAQADRVLGNRLGTPLSELCFAGPADRLNRTDISQPALYVAGVACWRAMLAARSMGNGEQPIAATAGLSLGEYTALHIAGAFSFEEGLELVTLRGRAMQDAAESPIADSGGGGSMLALIGATDEQAQQICDQARGSLVLVCANFNAPGQVVLSGHKAACEAASKIAEATGVRSTMLAVAGAFHSPLMAQAAERLGEALGKATIQTPRVTVLSNVTGEGYSPVAGLDMAGTIRRRLAEQLTSPVRWAQCCRWMGGHVQGEYVEVAPGRTLAGLMRRINKEIKVTTHDVP